MRLALGIEYCGSQYCGWQRQNVPHSIQENVEKALSIVANEEITVYCAGRTDTGVHAIQQVVHFDTNVKRKMYSWVMGANTNLPDDICVLWAKEVDDNFHARFAALSRSYQYIILNRRSRPGLEQGKVTWEYQPLDEDRMQEAANLLKGEHDFTSFRAVACQAKSPVREITRLDVQRDKQLIRINVQANAFLHHMVRNIAGVLIEIGCGNQEISWAGEILAVKDRTKAAKTAAPDGLYLSDIEYPEEYDIPKPNDTRWTAL